MALSRARRASDEQPRARCAHGYARRAADRRGMARAAMRRQDLPTAVLANAPLRLDFAGGWTDVPPFSAREGGVVVNAAIGLRAHVTLDLGGKLLRLVSEELGETLECANSGGLVPDGKLPLLAAALRMFPVLGGFTLTTRCDAPPGSGLGSSGALGVALVGALTRARQDGMASRPQDVADQAWQVETIEACLAGGKQDQYAAAVGGFHRLTFRDPDVGIEPITLGHAFAAALERQTLICYTNKSRASGNTITRASPHCSARTGSISRRSIRACARRRWPSSKSPRRTPGRWVARRPARGPGVACSSSCAVTHARRRRPSRAPRWCPSRGQRKACAHGDGRGTRRAPRGAAGLCGPAGAPGASPGTGAAAARAHAGDSRPQGDFDDGWGLLSRGRHRPHVRSVESDRPPLSALRQNLAGRAPRLELGAPSASLVGRARRASRRARRPRRRERSAGGGAGTRDSQRVRAALLGLSESR